MIWWSKTRKTAAYLASMAVLGALLGPTKSIMLRVPTVGLIGDTLTSLCLVVGTLAGPALAAALAGTSRYERTGIRPLLLLDWGLLVCGTALCGLAEYLTQGAAVTDSSGLRNAVISGALALVIQRATFPAVVARSIPAILLLVSVTAGQRHGETAPWAVLASDTTGLALHNYAAILVGALACAKVATQTGWMSRVGRPL